MSIVAALEPLRQEVYILIGLILAGAVFALAVWRRPPHEGSRHVHIRLGNLFQASEWVESRRKKPRRSKPRP